MVVYLKSILRTEYRALYVAPPWQRIVAFLLMFQGEYSVDILRIPLRHARAQKFSVPSTPLTSTESLGGAGRRTPECFFGTLFCDGRWRRARESLSAEVKRVVSYQPRAGVSYSLFYGVRSM